MRKTIAALVIVILAGLALPGCYHIPIGPPTPVEPAKPTGPASAAFSFGSIDVSPLPIATSQSFNIYMEIENTGKAAGAYKADLLINGALNSSQVVILGPGEKRQASFQTSLASAGKYELKIGPQSRSIEIGQPRVPATIKISGDRVDGFDPIVGSTAYATEVHDTVEGHTIRLTAPAEGFIIDSIRVLGYLKSSTHDFNTDPIFGPGIWVYGPDIAAAEPISTQFTVNIYDAKRNRLYSGNFNKDLFSYAPGWVVVNITPTRVAGDFLVEIKTYNPPKLAATGWGNWDPWRRYVVHTWYYQICIGYENSTEVQSFVSQDGSPVPERYLTYNWLIQAAGYRQ